MNCPIHVSEAMRLVPSSEPLFHNNSITRAHRGKNRVKEADKRKIWRCRVENCPRVEKHEDPTQDGRTPWEIKKSKQMGEEE